jgi:hypothetical protein
MLKVAHLANGGITVLENQPDLTRGKFNVGIFPLLRHQLAITSCTPDDLATLSRFQLNVMDQGACRDVSERQGIAWFNICCRACDHSISGLKLGRGKDISLLSIGIMKQGDSSRSVRVIFNGSHFR